MARKGVIYLYTFLNGKVYVGQTRRDPQVRHREHLDPKIGPTNSDFWKAYQEQGEPKYEILEMHQSEDVEELIDVLMNEKHIISIFTNLQAPSMDITKTIWNRWTAWRTKDMQAM